MHATQGTRTRMYSSWYRCLSIFLESRYFLSRRRSTRVRRIHKILVGRRASRVPWRLPAQLWGRHTHVGLGRRQDREMRRIVQSNELLQNNHNFIMYAARSGADRPLLRKANVFTIQLWSSGQCRKQHQQPLNRGVCVYACEFFHACVCICTCACVPPAILRAISPIFLAGP